MFGALHLVSLLRGERTEAITRHRHDQLPTFGVGADHSPAFWRSVIRQLIALGALDIDTDGHGGLFLVADRARPILRGETRITLQREAPPSSRSTRTAAAATPTRAGPQAGPQTAVEGPAATRFDALRAWRMRIAKAQSLPPYVIFHDSTLREIAAVRPASLVELGEIKGVGASKLERYGTQVLEALAAAPG
jgi:ATP-dependent DNA helicase RecQ